MQKRSFKVMSGVASWAAMGVFTALTVCAAGPKPNIVVILSDDQSWVGSSQEMIAGDARTRSDYFQTPNIERLALMGMRFTQGFSPGASCCPTRRSLQTGQMPARHEYNGDREGWTATYQATQHSADVEGGGSTLCDRSFR
ncbi:sulfatase-like hydrolase/transferase [Novipirellula artificiosorum]|uniref:Sulfatase n=1 Tax=Novipirellula artificiosorum TaxID=2528016 RepID=A0A5C6DVK8_9BACT|nr:sulfatase-like hydrolase/transferase [Novipirellula artificiosorum]TWU40652.1 Sulfatase [Novipirellula artificiosorum]